MHFNLNETCLNKDLTEEHGIIEISCTLLRYHSTTQSAASAFDFKVKKVKHCRVSSPPTFPFMPHPVVQPRHKSDQRGDVSIRRNGSFSEQNRD